MKLAFKIFLCCFILSACANNAPENPSGEARQSADVKVQNYIDSIENKVKSDLASKNEVIQETASELSAIDQQERILVSQEDEMTSQRPASSIAQQQEAARKIQRELENRNPKPNEEQVQEGAVFQKVISTPKKKTSPKPTSTNNNKETKSEAKEVKKKTPIPTTKKPAKKNTAPAIKFEEVKMIFDTIAQGDIIDHKFVFTNTGTAPLEIKGASATCGCTQPSFPFIPIEPNEVGHISVRYNSVGKEGFQNPEITIKTNIDKKEITLVMEGFVVVEEEK